MAPGAPAVLLALEQSAAGEAIRQSSWIYAAANVGHVVGLALFAAAVAVLDLRLLGAFAATPPAEVVGPARRAAIAAFALMAATGAALFTAEASHLAVNLVFQVKALLVLVALVNAVLIGRIGAREAERIPAHAPFPNHVRAAALLSLGLWIAVAAAGRLVAYV